MPLDETPSHPTACSYVVRLHRDAARADGAVFGRLENISTGRRYVFGNDDELLAFLHLDASLPDTQEPDQP